MWGGGEAKFHEIWVEISHLHKMWAWGPCGRLSLHPRLLGLLCVGPNALAHTPKGNKLAPPPSCPNRAVFLGQWAEFREISRNLPLLLNEPWAMPNCTRNAVWALAQPVWVGATRPMRFGGCLGVSQICPPPKRPNPLPKVEISPNLQHLAQPQTEHKGEVGNAAQVPKGSLQHAPPMHAAQNVGQTPCGQCGGAPPPNFKFGEISNEISLRPHPTSHPKAQVGTKCPS